MTRVDEKRHFETKINMRTIEEVAERIEKARPERLLFREGGTRPQLSSDSQFANPHL